MTLSAPGNAELAAGGETATGTIDDNDDEPKVSITGAPVVTEGTAATFVVELSAESRKTVTVSYATADGTALAGEDYPAVDATELEFTSGVTAQTISVATTDDRLDEADGEDVHGDVECSRERGAGGWRRDGDGDDRRQRRRAEGEHHGNAGGDRGNRGDVRGGAERGEPQDGDGELRDGRRDGAGGRGLPGGGRDGVGVHVRSHGADDQRSDDGRPVGRGRRRDVHGDVECSRERGAGGWRRDGDGDDRRQRRRAEGEHHGNAGGDRGNRGDVRGGAERGEPQDGDGELRERQTGRRWRARTTRRWTRRSWSSRQESRRRRSA